MLYRILFASLIVTIFLRFEPYTTAADNGNGKNQGKKNPNDTILEFFHNCTCIPYFLCSEANKYMIAAKANILPDDLFCSDGDMFCCKNETTVAPEPSTTTESAKVTENPVTTTTTTEISVRELYNLTRISCGEAKTEVNVRILTSDTESASTINGEMPWMAEIFEQRRSTDTHKFKCAGSLIHPQVVLTATHCIVSSKEKQLRIVATGRDVFQNVGVDPDDERNVAKIIKHSQYYSGALYNDIALLILENPYNFSTTDYLNSVCLPDAGKNFTGKRCIAVGWGANEKLESIPLKKVDVPIVDSERCQNLLRKTRLGNDFNLHSSFICAGGEEGKDTCKGDGGSPLICLGDQYKFVQVGIVSWGVQTEECGIADQPGLYADVTKLRGWIMDQLVANKILLS